MQNVSRKVTYWLKVVSLGLILGLGLQFAQAWVAPTAAPPGGNVAGPVTLGIGAQHKAGKLGVNSNIAPINALEVGGGGNALIGGKVYSASTVATDLGNMLATKDYVDGVASASGGANCAGGVIPGHPNSLSCPATSHGKITKSCTGTAGVYATAQCWNGVFIVFMEGSESGG